MSVARLLNRPIEIEGQQVVLVEDRVGGLAGMDAAAQKYALLQPATELADIILVEEDAILRARDAHASLPVYGLWQTLIHSGVLTTEDQMQILPETAGDGLYIRFDSTFGRFVESDRYVAQLFDNHPDVLIKDCRVIEIPIAKLRLPPQSALTRKEMADRRAQEDRKFLIYGGVAAGVIALAGFAVDFALGRAYSSAVMEHQSRTAIRNERQEALRVLQTTRLSSFPTYNPYLDQLEQIYLIDANFEMPDRANSSMTGPALLVEVRAPHLAAGDIQGFMRGANVQYSPKGSYFVMLPGGGAQ